VRGITDVELWASAKGCKGSGKTYIFIAYREELVNVAGVPKGGRNMEGRCYIGTMRAIERIVCVYSEGGEGYGIWFGV